METIFKFDDTAYALISPKLKFKVLAFGFIVTINDKQMFASFTDKMLVELDDDSRQTNLVPVDIMKKYPVGSIVINKNIAYKICNYLNGIPLSIEQINLETGNRENNQYKLSGVLTSPEDYLVLDEDKLRMLHILSIKK